MYMHVPVGTVHNQSEVVWVMTEVVVFLYTKHSMLLVIFSILDWDDYQCNQDGISYCIRVVPDVCLKL